MKYCEKYFGLIEDLVEGELNEQIAMQMDSHIFDCPKCLKQYETLRREKEIYAQFLFNAEPAQDLWEKFQARLVSEKQPIPHITRITANPTGRKTKILGFLRPHPLLATACAALLFIWGSTFIWLKTVAPEKKERDNYITEAEFAGSQKPSSEEIDRETVLDVSTKMLAAENDDRQKIEPVVKEQHSKAKSNFSSNNQSFAAEIVKNKQKTSPLSEKKKTSDEIKPNEAGRRRLALRLQNLENEIAGQIEKIELLLRSFRNARTIGSLETFDVNYEKTQARRLLEKNGRLRSDAENYGIFYAEELLSRIEPYLLDIANLETNPAPEKVLDIKERVSSQNIIASLQVYSSVAGVQ